MKKTNNFDKILKYIANIYFVLIITILPLYFHDKYFDMVRTKADTFIYLTGVVAIIFILCNVIREIWGKNNQVFSVNRTDKIMLLFLILTIISTLVSDNKREAMWGTAGWHVGASFFILCGAAYYILSRYFTWNDRMSIIVVGVNLVVLILGMGNAIGIDPLKMNEGIAKSDCGKYLSTIGNVNWYAGYLCMILSLSTIAFVMTKRLAVRILGGIIIVLCIINGIACNSDSFFLGMIPIAVYILYFILHSKEGIRRFIELLLILVISILVTAVLKNKFIIKLDPIQNGISSYIGVLILSFLLIIAIILYKVDSKRIYNNSKKIVNALLITSAGVVFLIMAIANSASDSSVYSLVSKFRFNGTWGTNRGYIWKYSLKIFSKLNPLQMLLGVGPDTYGIIFRKYYFNEMIAIWNKNIINAHCELLQLLITNGIAGVIAYYGMFISAVKLFLKNNTVMLKAIAVAIISYLCQGMVNNIQGMCTPFVFILLGVGMSIVFREDLKE